MAESSWKRDFASGLVILAPLLVIVILINWLYNQIAELPGIQDYGPLGVLIALVVFAMLTFSIGYLMRTTLGDFFEEGLDTVMNQVPGVRVIYNASKMAVETAVTGTEDLQAPVKVETWNGMRMTAFKTGKKTDDGRDLLGRDPRRQQAVARKGAGAAERDAVFCGLPGHVPPHIAALGGEEIEGRGAPALRLKDRPEQEGLPADIDTQRGGRRLDLLPAELPEAVRQVLRDGHGLEGALEGGDGRPGAVGGQGEVREAGELLLPVGELLLQRLAPEPGALPDREVAVLDG